MPDDVVTVELTHRALPAGTDNTAVGEWSVRAEVLMFNTGVRLTVLVPQLAPVPVATWNVPAAEAVADQPQMAMILPATPAWI